MSFCTQPRIICFALAWPRTARYSSRNPVIESRKPLVQAAVHDAVRECRQRSLTAGRVQQRHGHTRGQRAEVWWDRTEVVASPVAAQAPIALAAKLNIAQCAEKFKSVLKPPPLEPVTLKPAIEQLLQR